MHLAKSDYNLQLAQEAMMYAREKLPLGACNIRSPKFGAAVQTVMGRENRDLCVKRVFTAFCYLVDPQVSLASETTVHFYTALEYRAGNCTEYAFLVLDYLKNNPSIKAEMALYEQENDHAFVILDREEGSDLQNPNTWGNSAVVCDPWALKCFFAHSLEAEMTDTLARIPIRPKLFNKKEILKVSFRHNPFSWVPFWFLNKVGNLVGTIACLDNIFRRCFGRQ